jgi:hypothetical protein
MYKLIFCISMFFIKYSYAFEVTDISIQDRQILERFFKFIITKSDLAYTLCGDKPCAIESCPLLCKVPCIYSTKIFFEYPPYFILIRGWKTWSKYASYFPSKKFVFRFVPQHNILILINKEKTKEVISNNLDLFNKYSAVQLTSNDFLEKICYPANIADDYLIKYNTVLLGILLGYGRNNSLSFSQNSYIQQLEKFNFDHSCQILNKIKSPRFISIQNGTNEEENNKIKSILQEARKNIVTQFKTQNYLENFIKILTATPSEK